MAILSDNSIHFERGGSAKLRTHILSQLMTLGWSSKIKLSYGSQITITALYKEFGLCLQTGNISRIYADLLKLEFLYKKNIIKLAVYIVPTKNYAPVFGSNFAHFERLVKELKIFESIISIPILVLGIDEEAYGSHK
jgi:hypothetical protein